MERLRSDQPVPGAVGCHDSAVAARPHRGGVAAIAVCLFEPETVPLRRAVGPRKSGGDGTNLYAGEGKTVCAWVDYRRALFLATVQPGRPGVRRAGVCAFVSGRTGAPASGREDCSE